MYFRYGLKILHEADGSGARTEEMILAPGRITQVAFQFPAGCAGLVGVRVRRGGFVLWPLTSDEWIVGSGQVVMFPCDYDLTDRPYRVMFDGYNQDDTYDHTITLSVTVEVPETIEKALLDTVRERIPTDLDHLVSTMQMITYQSEQTVTVLEGEMLPLLVQLLEIEQEREKREIHALSLADLTLI